MRLPWRRQHLASVELIEYVFYYDGMPAANGHRLTAGPESEGHRALGDQAGQLLSATSTPEMTRAAKVLRLTALNIQRQMTGPVPEDASPHQDPPVPDAEQRRTDLADLAVDVVTATDYLLRLLLTPAATAQRLTLAADAGAGYADEEAFDRLIRRRLDARGAAVRLGMRLLSELKCYFQATAVAAAGR